MLAKLMLQGEEENFNSFQKSPKKCVVEQVYINQNIESSGDSMLFNAQDIDIESQIIPD